MRTVLIAALALGAGLAGGWWLGRGSPSAAATAPVPADWIARVGERYVTTEAFVAEMRERGGGRPGLFQDEAQKRALLDDMLLQLAIVDAAQREGLDRIPENRRAVDRLLVSQYLRETLRKEQEREQVDARQVQAYFDANVDSYTVPARRRVAMLRIGVADPADEAQWTRAEARAAEAVAKVRTLELSVPHFGSVAREYSDDQATRYRGGVLGWLTEGRADSYRHDPALLDAAYALREAGELSAPVRGADAVFVARLVETEAARPRGLEQLRAGIEQRLLQDRYQELEAVFRARVLAAAATEVRTDRLADIAPPGPPGDATPQPPALPNEQESSP